MFEMVPSNSLSQKLIKIYILLSHVKLDKVSMVTCRSKQIKLSQKCMQEKSRLDNNFSCTCDKTDVFSHSENKCVKNRGFIWFFYEEIVISYTLFFVLVLKI
jgi:hypothetical protein